MRAENLGQVSKLLCYSYSQAMTMQTCFLIPSIKANINFSLWQGHMLRSHSQTCVLALVSPMPALFFEKIKQEGLIKQICSERRRKETRTKMDTSVREQRTSALMEAGVPSTRRKSFEAITLPSSPPAHKTRWGVEGMRWQRVRNYLSVFNRLYNGLWSPSPRICWTSCFMAPSLLCV